MPHKNETVLIAKSRSSCRSEYTEAICVDANYPKHQWTMGDGKTGGPLLVDRGAGYVQVGVTHGKRIYEHRNGPNMWSYTTMLWTSVRANCDWIKWYM